MLNHIGTQTIETDRLILRRFVKEDIQDAFNNWVTEKEVVKFLTWPVHKSIDITEKVILHWISSYENLNFYQWAIVPKEFGKAIGSITVVAINESNRRCEVGYCIGKNFWGKGYMTEALRAVSHYMLFNVNINRLQAVHHPLNTGSGKVMEKVGMQFEGVLRGYLNDNYESLSDKRIYAILQEDLFNTKTQQDFMSTPIYSDGVIELHCERKLPANDKKGYVPYYVFQIKQAGKKDVIGLLHLRIGFNEGIYYCGHIGYIIDDKYHNKGYATRACLLVKDLAKQHGFKKLLITNNPDNIASRRVCEKIGAELIRIVDLPEWTEMYREGERSKCIYEWNIC